MKKVILALILTFTTLLATGEFKTSQFPDCSELKLNESKSIISCLNGDYEVTFEVNDNGKRNTQLEPTIKILSVANQVTQYIQQK